MNSKFLNEFHNLKTEELITLIMCELNYRIETLKAEKQELEKTVKTLENTIKISQNKHIGSNFDDFMKEVEEQENDD